MITRIVKWQHACCAQNGARRMCKGTIFLCDVFFPEMSAELTALQTRLTTTEEKVENLEMENDGNSPE